MASGLPTTSIVPPDQSSFYSPLPTSTSFRLLHFINAGEGTGALECRLETYEIGQHPSYRALSYTWGQPYYSKSRDNDEELPEFTTFDFTIPCDGRNFRVTKNLFNAITTLVSNLKIKYLWVDAVCINQSDISSERPQQVSLMGRIFGSACEVLVWLGHYINQTESFFWSTTSFVDAVEHALEEHGEGVVFNRSMLDRTLMDLLGLEWSALTFRRLQNAMHFYGKCRIFDRAWVVPELAQAVRPRTFCGEIEIDWGNLRKLARWFERVNWDSGLANIEHESYPTTEFMQQPFCGTLKTWNLLRDQRDTERYQRSLKALYSVKLPSQHEFATLLQLVAQLRYFRTTDPRDHVFAAFSFDSDIGNSVTNLMRADYAATVAEVYNDFAVESLQRLPVMNLLWYLDSSDKRLQTEWPSWVPDWRFPAPKPISKIAYGCGTFNNVWAHAASTEAMGYHETQIDIERMRLNIMAVSLSSITGVAVTSDVELSEQQRRNHDRFLLVLLGWLELCDSLPNTYKFAWDTPQSQIEALWRTIIMDCTLDGASPPPQEWKSLFAAFVAWKFGNALAVSDCATSREGTLAAIADVYCTYEEALGSGDIPSLNEVKDIEAMLRLHYSTRPEKFEPKLLAILHKSNHSGNTLENRISLRRPFRAENGMLGSGPKLAQAGDQIWLLKGLNTPAILRPTGTPDEYKIVGECYLHGCMKGELFLHGILNRESAKPIVIV